MKSHRSRTAGCSQPGAHIAIDRAIHGRGFDQSYHDNGKHLKKIYEMLCRHQAKKFSQIPHSGYSYESVAFTVLLLKEGIGLLISKIWGNRHEMQIMRERISAIKNLLWKDVGNLADTIYNFSLVSWT